MKHKDILPAGVVVDRSECPFDTMRLYRMRLREWPHGVHMLSDIRDTLSGFRLLNIFDEKPTPLAASAVPTDELIETCDMIRRAAVDFRLGQSQADCAGCCSLYRDVDMAVGMRLLD
jgi:hypothetical protein